MLSFITDALLGKVKNYLTLASLFIAVLAGGYGFISKVRADRAEAEANNYRAELLVKTTEVVTYQNKLGQTVTKTYEYERDIADLEHSKDSLEQSLYRTIKASKVKANKVTEATIVSIESKGGGTFDSVRTEPVVMSTGSVDSVVVKHFNDGYLDATIYEDSLSYTYNDSITLLKSPMMVDRKFFLWRLIGWQKKTDRDMVEIVSANPNSELNGRVIQLQDK